MKTLKLSSIALLLLCGFFSCKKESLTNERTDGGYADLSATSEMSASATINGSSIQSDCPECVENFTPTTLIDATYGVLTLSGNSLTPTGNTIKTVESTKEIFTVGSTVKVGNNFVSNRVNVTVSHDATNVYFTFERVESNLSFGHIEFYSPALLPMPENNSSGNQIKYGFSSTTNKIQIIRSRTSLGPCSTISFTFRVGGGGVPDKKDAETLVPLTYVLSDLCPPSCSIEVGDYRTQTRGYWRNNNGQAFLTNNPAIFENLTIGDNNNTRSFTNPIAVKEYLEIGIANGTPNVLPTAGTFGAQVLTLLINVTADDKVADFSKVDGKLANLVINIDDADIVAHPSWAALTEWNGKSVSEILAIAQQVLGGTSAEYSPSHMNELVTAINENYDNGTVDTGLLTCGK